MRGLRFLLLLAASVAALLPLAPSLPAARAGESSLDGDLKRVAELRDKGQIDAAIEIAKGVVEGHPESVEGHVALQDLHLEQGREAAIRASYQERAKGSAATADDHFLYARLLPERRASPVYRKALRLDPKHYWANCVLGDLETKAGRLDKAAEHFAIAHEARPKSSVPLNGLGWVAERRGDVAEAEKYYGLAIDADPDDALPRTNLGLLLVGANRIDEARPVLEAARERSPNDAMILLALGMADAAAGEIQAAVKRYEEASKLPRQTIVSLNVLASTYTGLEQFDLARGVLDRAINEAPENETTRFNFAYLELAQGNAAEALAWVKKILAADGRSAGAYFLAGLCHESAGDAKEAERAYKKAVDLDDENPSHHQALAALAGTRGDWRLALKHHRRAVELTNDDPDALLDLAFAYAGAGDHRNAAKTFEVVVEKRPDDLVALMNIGLLYHTELRDRDRAIAAYEAYLTKGGKDPRVRAWLDELR